MLALGLVSYGIPLLCFILNIALAQDRHVRRLEQISEAHQLYCNECNSRCHQDEQQQQQQRQHRKHRANTTSLNQDEIKAQVEENAQKEDDEATLSCRCESIFDLKSRGYTCKNMSQAGARINKTNNPRDPKTGSTWSGAIARSKVERNNN